MIQILHPSHQLLSRIVLGIRDGQHFVTSFFQQLHTQYCHTVRFWAATTHISVVPCQDPNSAIIPGTELDVRFSQRELWRGLPSNKQAASRHVLHNHHVDSLIYVMFLRWLLNFELSCILKVTAKLSL